MQLSKELYGKKDGGGGTNYSSADDDSEDYDTDPDDESVAPKKKKSKTVEKSKSAEKSNTSKSAKKSKSPKSPKNKVKFDESVEDKGPSMVEPGFLKRQASRVLSQQVSSAQLRVQAANQRNAELEQQKIQLLAEIDAVSKKWAESRDIIESMNKQSSNFMKERRMLKDRIEEMEKELHELQSQKNNQTIDLEKRIQRQQTKLNMKMEDNKDLQKQVKELNLQNEELIKQHELMSKQMRSVAAFQMKNKSNDSGVEMPTDQETVALLKKLDNVTLDEEEEAMEPADLLLHRFAALEANDLRLNSEQRMKKTAKMMTDLSDDINGMMGKWLPKNKVRSDRTKSKTMVFQVRQLIGHFNVLVGQMKEAERDRERAAEDLKRKDRKIKDLEEANLAVFKLKNEVKSKDMKITQLERDRDYYKMRVEDEENAEQTEMAVQDQVLYLTNIMRQRKSTNLQETVSANELSLLAMMSASNQTSVEYGQPSLDLLSPYSAGGRGDNTSNVHALTPMHMSPASDGDDGVEKSSFGFPKFPKSNQSNGSNKRHSFQGNALQVRHTQHGKQVSAEIEYYSDEDDADVASPGDSSENMSNGHPKQSSTSSSHTPSLSAGGSMSVSIEDDSSSKKKKRKKSSQIDGKKKKRDRKIRSQTVGNYDEMTGSSKKGKHSKRNSELNSPRRSKKSSKKTSTKRQNLAPEKDGKSRRKGSAGNLGGKSSRSSKRSGRH